MKNEVKACISYFSYLVSHKIEVAKRCFKEGLYLQGLLHDWSKFLPSEYTPFAYKFKWPSEKTPEEHKRIEHNFRCARNKHFNRNSHHWKYWVLEESQGIALEMPDRYLKEMICDWEAVGKLKEDCAKEFYEKNKSKIVLHPRTRAKLENILMNQ
jgi:hypothetical protein